MAEKRVVTRKRSVSRRKTGEFSFTADDIPVNITTNVKSDFVREYYHNAWKSYQDLPMPGLKDEAWRRTDIRRLNAPDYRLPVGSDNPDLEIEIPRNLRNPMVGKDYAGQILLSPMGVESETGEEIRGTGVVFTDLSTAWVEYPHILEKILGNIVRPVEGKFASLSAALASNGVLIYVPRGYHLEKPLHSVLWAPGTNMAYFDHVLVYVDDDASLTYVHETASPADMDGSSMRAGTVEVYVGKNSDLKFVELQTLGKQYWNFSHERVRVEGDGRLDWIFGAIGTRLTKSFMDLDLAGKGAEGRLSGFYFTDDNQHLDHDTQQNHLAENTTSDLLFKGALKDQSRSVWQGMIYVAPGAQKTDGYQANRNLVLSSKARADSIPGLEILADDVRCTHGATVGKIDPEQIFYLLSRGIPYEAAERIIVEGFFDPIMQRIPFEGIRTRFQDAIIDKMG